MRWPWTSVARLDDAHAEIAWLRQRIEELEDKRERRERVSAGLPEAPRTERAPMEPMPMQLERYIGGFASASIKRQMRSTAYKRHAKGEPWSAIEADITADEEKE